MLYDKKWDKLTTRPCRDDFMDWLREQNPRKHYSPQAADCAAARYGRARGFALNTNARQAQAFGFAYYDWAWIANSAATYGLLLKRLEGLQLRPDQARQTCGAG